MVALHYMIGFTLLVVIYFLILRRIRRMRKVHGMIIFSLPLAVLCKWSIIFWCTEQNRMTHHFYGATETLIIRGQSQAKKRVILFLTIFVVTGFFSKSELCTIYCGFYCILLVCTLSDLFLSLAISVDEIHNLFETDFHHIRSTLILTPFQFSVYMLQVCTTVNVCYY